MKCNLCGSHEIEIILHPSIRHDGRRSKTGDFIPTAADYGIYYKLARCRNCDIVFSVVEEAHHIEEGYSTASDPLYLMQSSERISAHKRALTQILPFVSGGSRLLDIGSSYGLLLQLARERGLDVYGIELSADACEYCKDTLGLNVFCGKIDEAPFPPAYFDVITAIDVIEHLDNPSGFVSKINGLLKPGGILYLVTPNRGSFSAKLLGYRWWSYRRMHIYYFSKDVLYNFLGRNGFTIISDGPYKKSFKIGFITSQLREAFSDKLFYPLFRWFANATKDLDLKMTLSYGDIAVLVKKT